MIHEQEKTLNAMRAKTARACDSCVHKRARWYCPADDAFLCQPCDTSVHSANQLARRHERVRLGGRSRSNNLSTLNVPASVSWPKKTRTPRHHHKITPPCTKQDRGNEESYLHGEELGNFFEPDVVPEIGCEEGLLSSPIEYEDQRIHRVPVVDPFMAEDGMIQIGSETNDLDGADDLEIFQGFLASNLDFEDFDGDWQASSLVKVEEEDSYVDGEFDNNLKLAFDMSPETTLKCELRCSSGGAEEEDRETAMTKVVVEEKYDKVGTKFLSLNYDAVLAAWDSQGSPWTTGIRPDFDPSNCLPNCMAEDTTLFGAKYHLISGEMALLGGPKGHGGLSDDTERGAKVSRYREKRRSRLFSKKIRYEVRKLNAEKRPRMKGRFVKRSSTAAQVPFACLNNNN